MSEYQKRKKSADARCEGCGKRVAPGSFRCKNCTPKGLSDFTGTDAYRHLLSPETRARLERRAQIAINPDPKGVRPQTTPKKLEVERVRP